MIQALSDTHALIWYVWDDPRLSTTAKAVFQTAAPGVASQDQRSGSKFTTAHASMNHLAISIPLEEFDAYVERLKSKGVRVHVINHADNDKGYEVGVTAATWVRSMYFQDPSGIALELAAYTRAFRADDVSHAPATYADRERFLAKGKVANGH